MKGKKLSVIEDLHNSDKTTIEMLRLSTHIEGYVIPSGLNYFRLHISHACPKNFKKKVLMTETQKKSIIVK